MRRTVTKILLTTITILLLTASSAFARTPGGQGWWGTATDLEITNVMFGVILFFPAVIVVFSLIHSRLDKRKHAKLDAAKRRAVSPEWRGGW